MLHAWRHPYTREVRLYVRGVSVEAWISPEKPRGPLPSRQGVDWVLWVRRGNVLTLAKCPQRLEVQSLLRAWLPERYRRPLFLMSFDELCRIAADQDARRAAERGIYSR